MAMPVQGYPEPAIAHFLQIQKAVIAQKVTWKKWPPEESSFGGYP